VVTGCGAGIGVVLDGDGVFATRTSEGLQAIRWKKSLVPIYASKVSQGAKGVGLEELSGETRCKSLNGKNDKRMVI